jgi:hypothetical protein
MGQHSVALGGVWSTIGVRPCHITGPSLRNVVSPGRRAFPSPPVCGRPRSRTVHDHDRPNVWQRIQLGEIYCPSRGGPLTGVDKLEQGLVEYDNVRHLHPIQRGDSRSRIPLPRGTSGAIDVDKGNQDGTARSRPSRSQSTLCFGIGPPASNSATRTSASSPTRSGRMATARHYMR